MSMEKTTTATAAAPGARVAVLLPLPLAGSYDYAAPRGTALAPGDVVRVPLGRRELLGVVWGAASGAIDEGKLKEIAARLDVPPMPEVERRFVDWVASYTLAPPGAVLRMALSVPEALEPPRLQRAYRAVAGSAESGASERGVKSTPARRRVLAAAAEGPARTATDLARAAGVSPGVVASLAELGLLEAVDLPTQAPFKDPDLGRAGLALGPDQRAAADALTAKVAEGGFGVTLLDGVTGSGKTEVYFEAIAATLAAGRQALVLVPEIALTAQWLERFEARFGVAPAQWHSDLTQAERRFTWRAMAEGKVKVVVGARSALFLPFPDLGLIVVDEEHDSSFKQEDGVIYHARDMAIARARLGAHAIVLASATPSLETVENVRRGRYASLRLPDRHGGAAPPEIVLVDLKKTPPPTRQSWLSPPLREALAATLGAREQAMLFLNRRGYAPLTLCRTCGLRLQCPNCSAWLVEHRHAGRLQCHHCGTLATLPAECPECHARGSFAACGPGVERLAEEVQALHPEARLSIMASDTLDGPTRVAEFIRAIEAREVDVLIGTQVVAKGHHFPCLTLVGVVDADLGLDGGELRAAERTYQLLAQVAGRAGRAALPGKVLVQTTQPTHPVMRALAAGDRDGFLAAEAAQRRRGAWPPFARLAALIVSGPHGGEVERVANSLARAAPRGPGISVLGPAPAPLALLRGRHRQRLLLKTERGTALQPILRAWLAAVPVPHAVRVQVDVDPYSFA
ncbi:MAG TPA: primosomal protein N' [Alphaproteobacteria bacterium]|nr:primosomal protein N' [Alphaproteobacteria bacterium]